jgi:hypothetical protein
MYVLYLVNAERRHIIRHNIQEKSGSFSPPLRLITPSTDQPLHWTDTVITMSDMSASARRMQISDH